MTNISSNPTLINVTFDNNSVTSYAGEAFGGGMSNQNSSPSITSVTFSANSANYGGGLFNYNNSGPTLENVTFNGNSATSGGGIYNWINSNPRLTNVTISGNSASAGGGISNINNSGPVIRNSILYGDIGGEIYNSNSVPLISYSIVQGGYAGTGNLNADPLLGLLQNNGGFTQTMALAAGSPAIDVGNDGDCPSTDQRGVARPIDGDYDGTATCDLGAFEYEPPPIADAGTYDDTDPNWSYVGSWAMGSGFEGAHDGTLHYTGTVGDTASFTFSGTQFILTYTRDVNRGDIGVYVDGGLVTTIDATGAFQWQDVYISPSYTSGTHVVQFTHAGGAYIDIDSIEIKN